MKNNMFIKMLSIGLVSIVLFSGFAAPVNAGEQKMAKQEQSVKGDFARGARLWSETCSSCHNMRDPKDFSDKGWELIVQHMRLRANLNGQEARDILEFLKRSN